MKQVASALEGPSGTNGTSSPSTSSIQSPPSPTSTTVKTTNNSRQTSGTHGNGSGVAYDNGNASSAMLDHIYQSYLRSEYSDVTLLVHTCDGPLTLYTHSLILSSSPYFANLLTNYSPHKPLSISLPSFISAHAFNIAITTLYHPPSVQHVNLGNAAAVLCAAYLLGMDYLGREAAVVCLEGVRTCTNPDEVETWVNWIVFLARSEGTTRAAFEPGSSGLDAFGKGLSPHPSGSPYPNSSTPHTNNRRAEEESQQRNTYVAYAQGLRNELMERLVVRLPREFGAFSAPSGEGQAKLVQIYSRLPFNWFKDVVESRQFVIASDMDRFNFAKKIVAERKRRATLAASTSGTGPSEFEEAVVLQFGGTVGGATAVSILQKMNKKKLWKVNS